MPGPRFIRVVPTLIRSRIEPSTVGSLRAFERRVNEVWGSSVYFAMEFARRQLANQALTQRLTEIFWFETDLVFESRSSRLRLERWGFGDRAISLRLFRAPQNPPQSMTMGRSQISPLSSSETCCVSQGFIDRDNSATPESGRQ